ncbi:MAG: transcription antiterminator [Planctomycetes bacterium]|nr:transcription antiterminator [Planctomycetota bacterium]
MPTILPRLRNLLAMLAREPEPLPVREVADRLRVSRRTVFRELANVDAVIGSYGLEVGSRPGEGVTLEGPATAKTALLRDLEKLDHSSPADRQDRQDRLVLAIVQAPGHKLATYAERFRVSAPTISHDLDDIEPWLAERGLLLSRKPGSGIAIQGNEMAVRRTVLTLMARMAETAPYPHPDILLDILDLAPDLDPILDWMTPQSRDAFQNYLAVLVQRLMDGHRLTGAAGERYDAFTGDAHRLATVLAEAFNIDVGSAEVAALTVEMASCRPNKPRPRPDRDDDGLAALAAEMIDRFDPARAPLLRLDEVLLDGLVAHLRTAAVRIRHRIDTVDPMRTEIAATYPDIMERCRTACDVLRPYGDRIAEDEISLVAAHFGAALLRLREEGTRRRTVRVGIICVHGIGSSYLLASQVKQAFSTRVLVEVGWHGDRENWQRYDLLVSTTPLNYDGAPVVVPPILGDDDLSRLENELATLQVESVIREQAPGTFVENVRQLEDLARQVRGLVENFASAVVPPGVTFRELAGAAGGLFRTTTAGRDAIARDLIKREAVATQVIPEFRIVLLHCRTDGTATPLFGIVRPDGDAFTDPGFLGARAATVMLLPPGASRESAELMGCLSSGLIQEDGFLEAVCRGDGEAVGEAMRRILGAALFQFSMQKLKG